MNDMPQPPGTPHHAAVLAVLKAAAVLWEESRLLFARWDLTPAQFNLLNLLASRDAGISQTELGRELLTHRSNVTGLVDRLEERDLVRRKPAEGDRRAWLVSLTPSGEALVAEVRPHYYAASARVTAGWSLRRATEIQADMDQLTASAAGFNEKAGTAR